MRPLYGQPNVWKLYKIHMDQLGPIQIGNSNLDMTLLVHILNCCIQVAGSNGGPNERRPAGTLHFSILYYNTWSHQMITHINSIIQTMIFLMLNQQNWVRLRLHHDSITNDSSRLHHDQLFLTPTPVDADSDSARSTNDLVLYTSFIIVIPF